MVEKSASSSARNESVAGEPLGECPVADRPRAADRTAIGRRTFIGAGGFLVGALSSLHPMSAQAATQTLDVRAYGATGDGTTDDSGAIQSAIDAVPAGGGTVFFPAGRYAIGRSLVISRPGTRLLGDHAASTIVIAMQDTDFEDCIRAAG